MNSRKLMILVLAGFFLVSLTGCGIRSIPKSKNAVEATLAEVTNQYKRRADLIPNLVKVVKAYATHESDTLTAVVEARAKASQITIDPGNLDAAKLKQFQAAQGQLSHALGKLMVVVERYPDLKADRNFRELQAQLEGTENRITVARNRHIQAINNYNNNVTTPPESWVNSLMYHHEKMSQWSVSEVEAEVIEKPPEIDL